MATPCKCPCCDGFGIRQRISGDAVVEEVQCVSCGGTGLVWDMFSEIKNEMRLQIGSQLLQQTSASQDDESRDSLDVG